MNRVLAAKPRGELSLARFYAILDTGYVPREAWAESTRRVLSGGADVVQVRAKRESREEREAVLRATLEVFAEWPGPLPYLVLNDDVELCARYPGVGLHVGQGDLSPREARARIGPDRVIGRSTHSRAQAERAMALPPGVIDYFCVGPVFATPTKPDYEPVGLELVGWTAARRPVLPWFCIGGINRRNVSQVVGAGGQRVVVVSDVLQAEDPAAVIAEIRKVVVAAA